MAHRVNPPGYENWTSEEIRLGHRLSEADKRFRRTYWVGFIGLLIFVFIISILNAGSR